MFLATGTVPGVVLVQLFLCGETIDAFEKREIAFLRSRDAHLSIYEGINLDNFEQTVLIRFPLKH
jgi:hypothetical protein